MQMANQEMALACIEIPKDFFLEKIKDTGHEHKTEEEICVGMIFLPRTEYSMQEKSKTIVEQVLLENDFIFMVGDKFQ